MNIEKTDWILRVGYGDNFKASSKYKIWGIKSHSVNAKNFLAYVKNGDRLWFVIKKSGGKIIAVATYKSHNKRELGPLINITASNEELGWDNEGNPDSDNNWDTEIHYENLYNLENCELFTNIIGPAPIRKYSEKCSVNLPNEYQYITKYSKAFLDI